MDVHCKKVSADDFTIKILLWRKWNLVDFVGGPGSESVENRMSVEDAVEKLTRSSKSQGWVFSKEFSQISWVRAPNLLHKTVFDYEDWREANRVLFFTTLGSWVYVGN